MSPDDNTSGVSNAPLSVDTSGRRTLHLGVLVQAYRTQNARTTADVAEILEAKYGVMEAFWRVHGQEGADALAESVVGALESLLMGQSVDPFASGAQKIETAFRDFISSGEAEHVGIPGTPTQAAQRGVNHRLKHPYRKRNPQRVSFRDSGLYLTSFRAWAD